MADTVVQKLSEPNKPAIQKKQSTVTTTPVIQQLPLEEKTSEQELEADNDELLQKKPIFESASQAEDEPDIQRVCSNCAKEKALQTKSENSANPSSIETRLNSTKGAGSPLPENTRSGMEQAFGADFSGVRVHTGGNALQMNKELGAQAFTHGSDIYFDVGKFDTKSVSGKHLLAHELTHVIQQEIGLIREKVQLSPAEDLIDSFTSWNFLDESALGQALVEKTGAGEYNFIQEVLNELGSTDRDDVSYECIRRLTNEQLDRICLYEPGRRLLDRMFDELTSGSVAEEEKNQADRIIDAKSRAIPTSQFPTSLDNIKIFPFKTPGITVFHDAPISAERRTGGRIWVKMPTRISGMGLFIEETKTLPTAVFIGGIELPENEIVGVRLYDFGDDVEPVFKPALFLVQLANETDTAIASTIGEVVGIGLTLGVGELVALGVEASMAARVLLWADRAAFALGTLSVVINEHRGWILSAFGESGRSFLYYNSLVQRATAVYGMGRTVFALGSLLNNFRKSFQNWRVAAEGINEVGIEQQRILRSIEQEGETFFNQTDEMQNAGRRIDPEDAPSGSNASDSRTELGRQSETLEASRTFEPTAEARALARREGIPIDEATALTETAGRQATDPHGISLIGERAIARFFGIAQNASRLPEAIMQMRNGRFILTEVKNQRFPDIGNALGKFRDVIGLMGAKIGAFQIGRLELYISRSRFRGFDDTNFSIGKGDILYYNNSPYFIEGAPGVPVRVISRELGLPLGVGD